MILDKLLDDLPEVLREPVKGLAPDVREFARRVAVYRFATMQGDSKERLDILLGDVWTQKVLMVQRVEIALRDAARDAVLSALPKILAFIAAL
jgi:hypothetical protein